jgi:hypothetical protein
MIKSMIWGLKELFLALVHDLLPAIKLFIQAIVAKLGSLFPSSKKPLHTLNRASCIPIHHPAFKKPDPLIYDQYYLMSLGLAVSWQNPDIQILQAGIPVTSAYDLQPATKYTLIARIWNGSTSGVCSGMPVTFSYLSFGVGTTSHPIGVTAVNLGVMGSAHSPAFAKMDWVTPATPGHYCVQVSFVWPDDLNPSNNLGQENTQVVVALSPADFSFTLRNADAKQKEFRFEADMYQIPPQPPCSSQGKGRKNAPPPRRVPPATIARNSRAANPLPAGWLLSFNPANPVLAPGAEIEVLATVTPADTFHGTQPLNIHTFSGKSLVGGVTIMLHRN